MQGSVHPSCVTDEPRIHGVAVSGEAPSTGGRGGRRRVTRGEPYAEESEVGADLCGDMGLLGFRPPCKMCVFDVHNVDTYAASYDGRRPDKILSQHKWRKKGKYPEACLERRRHFTPLVFSADGVMGEETKATTKQLAAALPNKWGR